MYSKIKNVQIIVSLLKQHNIRHIVLSAGTRHVPIAHSVENDDFFHCYSVVDERSAGYYALGLAKELGEPVALACTSSTATCNYTPAVAEAYFQKVPLLFLTGDRDPYHLGQLEDQMINQVDMYGNFCKKCVTLPIVNNEKDEWYCSRLVNEAILELTRNGTGPVQINFPINQSIDDIADASVEELPVYNKIERVDMAMEDEIWANAAAELSAKKRILVICGSASPASAKLKASLEAFFEKYNCVILTEYLSNIRCNGAINAFAVAESITGEVIKQEIKPDLVIFFGGNYVSRWKPMMRTLKGVFKSWVITDDGIIVDQFQNLTKVFQCPKEYFFRRMAQLSSGTNDKEVYNIIMDYKNGIPALPMREIYTKVNGYAKGDAKFKKLPEPLAEELIPDGYLSGFSAMAGLAAKMPNHSLLHLSILNSTRITQLFDLPDDVEVYSNIGTDGIDGSMSTTLGQAQALPNKNCYLVIGDLSFFYDMNSLSVRNIGKNVHILLINNGGGGEFYLSMGPKKLPNIDMHISAAHSHQAKMWVESNGIKYMSASTLDEFDSKIDDFMTNDGPVVFEVFTEKQRDVMVYKGYRRFIHQDSKKREVLNKVEAIPGVKQALETEAGQKAASTLKDKLKGLF